MGCWILEHELQGFLDEKFTQLQDENDPEFVTEVISLFFQDSEKQLGNLANELYVSCAGPYSTIFFKLGKRTWQTNYMSILHCFFPGSEILMFTIL